LIIVPFFPRKNYICVNLEKWVGQHFGRYFNKLLWSPCTGVRSSSSPEIPESGSSSPEIPESGNTHPELFDCSTYSPESKEWLEKCQPGSAMQVLIPVLIWPLGVTCAPQGEAGPQG
jgi:hypothetical protein